MLMSDGPKKIASGSGLKISVAVVEVRNVESQEEAWRRYLAEHPESFWVDVKIFHYPNPNSGKT
jgi:hypothetical protein